jgi:hypothetical protein
MNLNKITECSNLNCVRIPSTTKKPAFMVDLANILFFLVVILSPDITILLKTQTVYILLL